MVKRILVVMLTLIGAAAVSVAGATPAHAAPCTQQTGVYVSDPNNPGWSWNSYWWCPNAANAYMYGDANFHTPTAQMVSSNSWFVCYRRGITHSGGNDVWYYSQGDISHSSRQAWGYMPASSVYTHIDPWPGVPMCPDGFSPPAKVDGPSTVLMIHGYNPHGYTSCSLYFQHAKNFYPTIGITSMKTLKYYAGDSNCDANTGINANDNTSIATIGANMAWYIYNNYSRWGKNVDVLAHSMGGLIIRTAIAGTQNRNTWPFNAYSWPPYLYVQDVSTLGTPYEGGYLNTMAGCVDLPIVGPYNDLQCREMVEGNYFIQNWIKPYGNPQAWQHNGRGGTDWTVIGATRDEDVLVSSATELHQNAVIGHKVIYTYGSSSLEHEPMMWAATNGSYRHYYCDWYNPCDQTPPFCITCEVAYNINTWNYNGAAKSPIEVAAWGNWYANGR